LLAIPEPEPIPLAIPEAEATPLAIPDADATPLAIPDADPPPLETEPDDWVEMPAPIPGGGSPFKVT
jgi:hypothetical protein